MRPRFSHFPLSSLKTINHFKRYDYKGRIFTDDDTNKMNDTSITSERLLQEDDKRNLQIPQPMTSSNYGSEYQKDRRYFET